MLSVAAGVLAGVAFLTVPGSGGARFGVWGAATVSGSASCGRRYWEKPQVMAGGRVETNLGMGMQSGGRGGMNSDPVRDGVAMPGPSISCSLVFR